MVFVTWQVEQGSSGTRHLQGYLVTKENPKNRRGFTMKWVKDTFGAKPHFEARIGTHDQAVAYANKIDTRIAGPWTLGEFKSLEVHQKEVGARRVKSTLLDVKAAIDAGATDRELYATHFGSMLRYKGAFDNYRLAMVEDDRPQPKVLVLWGPPGTGKSHTAKKICDNNGGGHWWRAGNGTNDWWDGYDPARHPVVVLDDFKGGIRYTTLLRMLDKFPMQVEVKTSTKQFIPKIIVITSNSPPNEWYFQSPADTNHDSSALLRRLSGAHGAVIEMKTKYVAPAAVAEPDLASQLDELIAGTLVPRGVAVRKEYLADVKPAESRAAVAAALVDLTTDEELSESEADVGDELAWAHGRVNNVTLDEARGMKFVNQEDFDRDFEDDYGSRTTSRYGGDDDDGDFDRDGETVDDGGDDDVDDKRQHPTPPEASEEVPWIDEVERDDYEMAVYNNRLRRAMAMTKQSTPLTIAKPLAAAGRFKKLGPQPVQSQLKRMESVRAVAPTSTRKRRLEDDDE